MKCRQSQFFQRLGYIFACSVFLLFLGGLPVFAISQFAVNYHFFSKKTAIRVEYFVEKNGKYVLWEDEGIAVLPGEYVSRIPVIYNEGMDCYVRAKILITSEQENSIPLTLEHIDGMSDRWNLIGEYFYYQEVLAEEQNVILFEGIHMPKEWKQAIDSGNQWTIEVRTEAVQADYFVPDFQSEDPWGIQEKGYEILDARDEEALEDNNIKEKNTENIKELEEFQFFIESEVEEIEIGWLEKFQDTGGWIPGQRKKQEIEIRNLDEKERKLYIRGELLQNSILAGALDITVLWKYQGAELILYQGRLEQILEHVKEKKQSMCLTMQGNSKGCLEIVLECPMEIDNTYSATEGSFRLVLAKDEKFGQENKTQTFENGTEEIFASFGEVFKNKTNMVGTSDDNNIEIWCICMGISAIILRVCVWKRKRKMHVS